MSHRARRNREVAIRRTCPTKKRFHSAQEAKNAGKWAPIPLYAYKCPECGFWHTTKHPDWRERKNPPAH